MLVFYDIYSVAVCLGAPVLCQDPICLSMVSPSFITQVRPELVSIGHSARKAALSVPLLGWFARTPAEDEALLRQVSLTIETFSSCVSQVQICLSMNLRARLRRTRRCCGRYGGLKSKTFCRYLRE